MKLSQETFNQVMETLCQAYEKDIPKERAKIYYDVLKDEYDDEDIIKMVPIVLKECKYFPAIANIVDAIESIDYMPRLK